VVDLQLKETVAFIEAKFEETFSEETKVIRAPGVRDTHIHCVFLLLDPARLTPNNHYVGKTASKHEPGGLDSDLDLSVLKALHGKTVVVPVISKADTCTAKHMEHLKGIVRKGLAAANEDPLESLELEIDNDDDDDDESSTSTPRQDSANEGLEFTGDEDTFEVSHSPRGHGTRAGGYSGPSFNGAITPGLSYIPLSVISPDSYEPDEPVGRHFPWGFADPYNEQHCDFLRLQYSVFSEWRAELREKSRENWYENWRSDRLGSSGLGTRRF
jgi:septin family protein